MSLICFRSTAMVCEGDELSQWFFTNTPHQIREDVACLKQGTDIFNDYSADMECIALVNAVVLVSNPQRREF